MKLHFESDLDYQLQAIEAVCDLFRGQEVCRTEFAIVVPSVAIKKVCTRAWKSWKTTFAA